MIYGTTKQTVCIEEREVIDGVLLYKRDRSQLWQARIRRVTGKWIAVSTKTANLDEAKAFALKYHQDLKDAQARGEIDVVRKFADVAKLTIKQLEAELASGVGRQTNRDYIHAIRGWLIPWSLVRIQAGPVFHRRQTHSLSDSRAVRGER